MLHIGLFSQELHLCGLSNLKVGKMFCQTQLLQPALPPNPYQFLISPWHFSTLVLGFDWSLHFKWEQLSPEQKAKRLDPTEPIK